MVVGLAIVIVVLRRGAVFEDRDRAAGTTGTLPARTAGPGAGGGPAAAAGGGHPTATAGRPRAIGIPIVAAGGREGRERERSANSLAGAPERIRHCLTQHAALPSRDASGPGIEPAVGAVPRLC